MMFWHSMPSSQRRRLWERGSQEPDGHSLSFRDPEWRLDQVPEEQAELYTSTDPGFMAECLDGSPLEGLSNCEEQDYLLWCNWGWTKRTPSKQWSMVVEASYCRGRRLWHQTLGSWSALGKKMLNETKYSETFKPVPQTSRLLTGSKVHLPTWHWAEAHKEALTMAMWQWSRSNLTELERIQKQCQNFFQSRCGKKCCDKHPQKLEAETASKDASI